MKYSNLYKLLVSIIICEFAGVIGSTFTVSQFWAWYGGLNKPFFNPPNWVFAPVWTILFVLMGISLYLVWQNKFEPKNKIVFKNKRKLNPLSEKFLSGSWKKVNIILVFTAQLVLNISWPVIFFGAHSVGAAFFELLMLWFAVLFTTVNFYRVSKSAALLLLPYILWVSFAVYLNLFIWIINLK